MSNYRYYFFIFLVCSAISVTPCRVVANDVQPIRTLSITVSILPQAYFAARIGGDRVRVDTLVQPGYSPATYAPTPRQMAGLATSDVFFRIGVPFENSLVPKLARSMPELTIVDQRRDIVLLPMDEVHQDHDDEHGALDPHTWLDPMLALRQSAIIRDTLVEIDPPGRDYYEANFAGLAKDLRQLDRQLRETLAPYQGMTIYTFHPAYGYFCRAYGLIQKAINPEGKDPGARSLARLIEQAQKDQVQALFVQPQFSDKAARTIARAIKAEIVELDPLAEDYLENMRSMAEQLRSSLRKPQN